MENQELVQKYIETSDWTRLSQLPLETLSLDHSHLSNVNLQLFSHNFNLKSLSINNCSIRSLHGLDLFPHLSFFSANSNLISVTGLPIRPCRIDHVSLNDNRIASLVDVFNCFPSSRILSLNENAVSDLNCLFLKSSSVLEELYLCNNLLHDPKQDKLSSVNLKVLNLSGNRISSVEILNGLSSLVVLNLSRNALQSLFSRKRSKSDVYMLIAESGIFPNLTNLNISENEGLESINSVMAISTNLKKLYVKSCGLPDCFSVLNNVLDLKYLRELNLDQNSFSMFYYRSKDKSELAREAQLYRAILIIYLPHLTALDDVVITPDIRDWARSIKNDLLKKMDTSLEPNILLLRDQFLNRVSPSEVRISPSQSRFEPAYRERGVVKEESTRVSRKSREVKQTRSKYERKHKNLKQKSPQKHMGNFESKLQYFLSPNRKEITFTDQLDLSRHIIDPNLRSIFVDYITEYHRYLYGYSVDSVNVNSVSPTGILGNGRIQTPQVNADSFDVAVNGLSSKVKQDSPSSDPFNLQSAGSKVFERIRQTSPPMTSSFNHRVSTAKSILNHRDEPYDKEGRKFQVQLPVVPPIDSVSPYSYHGGLDRLQSVESWDLLPSQKRFGQKESSFSCPMIEPFVSSYDESDSAHSLSALTLSIINCAFLSLDPLFPSSDEFNIRELSNSNNEYLEVSNYLKLFDVELYRCFKLFDFKQYRYIQLKSDAKRFIGFPLIPSSEINHWIDDGIPDTHHVFSIAPPMFLGKERFLICVVVTEKPHLMQTFDQNDLNFSECLPRNNDSLVLYLDGDERTIDRVFVRDCSSCTFMAYVVDVGSIGS
ncbi:hypothetical protein GEMRC1_007123 [Eukaryota sp. GEM-RC1]